jgi:hypothetical protein
MSEDPSSPDQATADPPRPGPAELAARAGADLNSRVETRLWQLRKGADRAEARMCVKFKRREFRVYVNGELLWSRNYGLEDTRQFDADADAKYKEMTGLGWEAL